MYNYNEKNYTLAKSRILVFNLIGELKRRIMNILVVTHSTKFSGANRSLFSIILRLKKQNNVIVLVNKDNGTLMDKLKEIDVDYIVCRYGWWVSEKRKNIFRQIGKISKDYAKYKTSFILNSLIRQLKGKNIEIVYTNTSTVDFGQKIASRLAVPHVWHVREFGKEDFSFIDLTKNTYKIETFNKADKIITISKSLREKFEKFVPIDKLALVYNGFEIENMIYSTRKHIDVNKVNIISVGQVCEAKGQNQIIKACEKLVSLNYNVNLYLAGDIDPSYLKSYIDNINAYPWLHILGQVNDIYELRKKMDIEVLCSRSEAFGRVTIEAMLHSIPFIGANCGCTKELVEDHYNGLLYEYGNIDSLVTCIIELINNSYLYQLIQENEVSFAKQFTIDKTINCVEKILRVEVNKTKAK